MKTLFSKMLRKTLSALTMFSLVVSSVGFSIAPAIPHALAAEGDVTVTIDKYINGAQANGTSAYNLVFPMSATWDATNIGAGTGNYSLDTSNSYEAVTALMSSGADYSTYEMTDGPNVGASCSTGQYYVLDGYTWGDTLEAAQTAEKSETAPSFTDLTTSKYVIVWNKTCVPTPTLVSPADNSTLTTATWNTADWSDVTNYAGPITYLYESANDPATTTDNGFTTPIYSSGPLSVSEISTAGTGEGTYYWHARAVDAGGNMSPWSNAFKTIVDNNDGEPATTTPATLTIIKNTNGGNGTFNFTVTGATATTSSITTEGGTGSSGPIQLNAGTSTVSELATGGWDFTNASCEYDNESTGQAVAHGEEIYVNNGDEVTCTFTNTVTPTPPTDGTLKVHIYKYLDNGTTTAQVPNDSNATPFQMESTWDAENIGAGTGNYVLGNNHGGTALRYAADTAAMSAPADYMTHEITDGTSLVMPVGSACQAGKYVLEGYKMGTSLAEAEAATLGTSTPTYTDITSDRYIIVVNKFCGSSTGGDIGGDVASSTQGVLHVDSIESVDTTATADNSYENGWKYIFHLTIPTSETKLAMKFSDWMGAASTTIPVANNMRISSAQTTSSTTPITVTAANTYTTPDMIVNADLNGSLAGNQVDVTVEVKIPVGTSNGSYTTTYGVRSQP